MQCGNIPIIQHNHTAIMPPDEKLFTQDELLHAVAREVAKQRMSDMERSIKEGELRTVSSFSELKSQITTLSNLVEKQSLHMETATNSLREEIKKDYATKKELSAEFDKLNIKVETQWSKLVLIIATITTVGTVISVFAPIVFKLVH
jgi:hypothetical protein